MKRLGPGLVAGLFLLAMASCGDPKNIVIKADCPVEAAVGEDFVLVCTAENTARKSQTMVSLDLADEYLAGFAVVSVDPPFAESMHVPLDNTMSYTFNTVLEPGQKQEYRFVMKPVYPGDYAGEIGFCINTNYSFLSSSVRTIVSEAPVE